LPTWATDRLRRSPGAPPEMPLVTVASDGRRRVVAAADPAALALGIRPGMPLTHARAMLPHLAVRDADPAGDAAALDRLAAWCLRYAPLVAADAPDGIWIDVSGAAHLFGGEAALLADLIGRLADAGLHARAAVADTPGAAHACARFGHETLTVIAPGAHPAAIAALPVAALRLPGEMVAALRRLGLEQVGALAELPRAPLVRRFGPLLAERLDQATGRLFEPIEPLTPREMVAHRLAFVEPLLTADAFGHAIDALLVLVCSRLEAAGEGARRLDLLFERVDGSVQAIRIGTAAPSRAPTHLARLLGERLEAVDPGLGVEAMQLRVTLAETQAHLQSTLALAGDCAAGDSLAPLIDRLENRLGAGSVWRAAPVESDLPERSVAAIPAVGPPPAASWPPALPRPLRLLDPPQPIGVMALLPDHPPAAFTWRGKRHRVRHADGPERIRGEWWRDAAETDAVRDYFAVEDETGSRFWLFRNGDGTDERSGDLTWFLHGVF
jgi:protein ImuB